MKLAPLASLLFGALLGCGTRAQTPPTTPAALAEKRDCSPIGVRSVCVDGGNQLAFGPGWQTEVAPRSSVADFAATAEMKRFHLERNLTTKTVRIVDYRSSVLRPATGFEDGYVLWPSTITKDPVRRLGR